MEKDNYNPTVKIGIALIGTQNGLYFKYTNDVNQGKIYSVGGINEQVNNISVNNYGGEYLLTISGKLYYCDFAPQDWFDNHINVDNKFKIKNFIIYKFNNIFVLTKKTMYITKNRTIVSLIFLLKMSK
ncbi:hypothetical protein [Spiroplasma endosymbiont of Polydrusus formosus]|uniref:hypothetical protein n=1 Tax=Spiroplasma endosymbiont of Polydrusus formosus TaxID=3139326 RepID=UPI0035B52C58